jgi:hypothetical protein
MGLFLLYVAYPFIAIAIARTLGPLSIDLPRARAFCVFARCTLHCCTLHAAQTFCVRATPLASADDAITTATTT